MENQTKGKQIYQILIISILSLFLILTTVSILVFQQKPKTEPAVTKVEMIPTLTVSDKSQLSLIKVDETTYEIYAESAGLDIVGYDILLNFKKEGDLSSVTSTDPNFSIFKVQKNNLLIITGTKKLTVKEPTIFSKTKILTIKGISPSIIPQFEKEATKFVDSVSKIHYPAITLLK